MLDKAKYHAKWIIRKYLNDAAFLAKEAFEVVEIEGNQLLNEGITLLQNLLIGGGGTAFTNAAAYLGVGDSAANPDTPTQTGLQASTNKLFKAMESAYPAITNQTTTWRAVFGANDANFAWNEFTVANGNSDSSTNLNRKVSAQGTKTSGQTWTLDLAITWS
jgi:hypothetical protein